MARDKENRAESLDRLRKAAIRDVKAGLKKRNINIPEIEGASEDDAALRDVQEWQAIARAFKDADEAAESSAPADNRTWGSADASASSAGTMDSDTPKSPKKGL